MLETIDVLIFSLMFTCARSVMPCIEVNMLLAHVQTSRSSSGRRKCVQNYRAVHDKHHLYTYLYNIMRVSRACLCVWACTLSTDVCRRAPAAPPLQRLYLCVAGFQYDGNVEIVSSAVGRQPGRYVIILRARGHHRETDAS